MQKNKKNKNYTVIPPPTQRTYSTNEYTRLGDKLRIYNKTSDIPEDELEILQSLRTSYKTTLAEIFEILQQCVKKIDKNGIVTYRVKRIDSIISKLKRMQKTQLPRIEDIAGCRCILSNNKQVYELKALLEQCLTIKSDRNDYIKVPKDNGYKSLHLVVQTKDKKSKVIEVQLRCENDHNWATLVEITDQIYSTKIKEGQNESELSKMLFLLSKGINELDRREISEFITIVKKKEFVDRINEVFVKNSVEVRKQWSDIEKRIDRNFYLISVDKENKSTISSYRSFTEAEKKYFEKFKEYPDDNIVLTHISDAKFEQISKAYSNYTLTYHSFSQDIMSKLKEIVHESFQDGEYFHFINHFSFYSNVYFAHALLQLLEMTSMNKVKCKGKKKQEWEKSFNDRIKKFTDNMRKLFLDIINQKKKTLKQHFMLYKMKKQWDKGVRDFRREAQNIESQAI